MKSTLLGLLLYDYDRGLILNYGDRLRFDGLLQGGGLHRFFQLEPTLFDVLRFFQLTVSRHS